MNIEEKETITFDEFRAWLTGLIRGKNGVLPDLVDWKMIKKMMDKVDETPKIITIPPVQPNYPLSDPWSERPWTIPQGPQVAPNTGDPVYQPPVIWCSNEQAKTYGELKDVSFQVTNDVTGKPVESDVNQAFDEFFTAHQALSQM